VASQNVLTDFGMTAVDLPFFAFTKKESHCHVFSKERTADLRTSRFFVLAKDAECGTMFGVTRAATPLKEEAAAEAAAPNGKYFVAVYLGVGLLIVALLRLRNPPQRKDE
jgi:hypothetical protein